MYCKKCGKEIADSAKFCRYCGTPIDFKEQDPVESQEDMANFEDVDDVKVVKHANRKKWVVPVCIAAGVAVLAGTGILAMNMSKVKKEDTKKAEQVKKEEDKKAESAEIEKEEATQKEETKTEEKQEPVFQEHAFEPDAETEAGLNQFVLALAYVDFRSCAKITAYDDAEVCKKFLHYAVRTDGQAKRIFNKYSMEPEFKVLMPESSVTDFLQNSLGKYDLSTLRYEGDQIVACEGEIGSSGVDDVVFSKKTQISETDIRLEGEAHYKSEGQDVGTGTFTITMTQNPESVWGGYTLKSIDSWNKALYGKAAENYVLLDSDKRYYTEEQLKNRCPYDLYLARNEIYARHGYIFDNLDLQEFFGGKTWYNPTTKNVSDSVLNDYERANVQLILSLENQ